MKKLITSLFVLIVIVNAKAQNTITEDTTVVFCHVSGKNIAIPASSINATPLTAFPSSLVVQCGIFNIYYEDFISNPNEGYADPVLGLDRRNTLCAVLNYLQSTFDLNWNGQIYDLYIDKSYSASNPVPVNYQSLAVAGTYFLPGTYGIVPGYFGGHFYDHYMPPGLDPDVNEYDGGITTNFDKVYFGTNTVSVNYWNNYLVTTTPCNYDLYTVLLHEMMHVMGWTSAVGEDATPSHFLTVTSNTNNIQSFTKFDEKFLWSGDVRFAPGSYTGRKLVVPTSATTGQLNPALTPSANILRNAQTWMTNTVSPINHKVYDGEGPVFPCFSFATFASGSFLSHLDFDQLSFYRGSQYSPGYQPLFVISPVLYMSQKKRELTLAELRYMKQLAYNYNPAFASSTTLSTLGNVTNQNLLDNNRPAYRNNIATVNVVSWPQPTPASMKAAQLFPETKIADYTIINPNGPASVPVPALTIDTHTILSLADLDPSQPVGVLPNSIYGIRGVTTGGNNHNSVVLTNSHTIVYSPPPGFTGRAEFAFQLWDGIEPGARKVITIDVNATFGPIATGNELVYDGGYEDATEVKTLTSPNKPGSIHNYVRHILDNELNMGYLFNGGSPYGHYANTGANWSGGIQRKESFQGCDLVTGNTFNTSVNEFGTNMNTFGLYTNPTSIAQSKPLSFPNVPGNECYLYTAHDNNAATKTLMNDLLTCKYYKIEFDVSFAGAPVVIGSNWLINLLAISNIAPDLATTGCLNNNAILYTTNQTIPINVIVSAITTNVTNSNWQHVTANFFYCGTPTKYILFKNLVGIAIDNITLKENTTPPPPLIVTAINSSTLFCPGNTATLTASVTNAMCTLTYTWLPMNLNTSSVVVTPTSINQSYTLIVNDGCRTGSAVITPTPSPAGTFTLPSPICQSQTLTNLAQYTSAFPSGGVFSGPGVVFNSPQYDLNASIVAAGTYSILYTVTNTTTNCQSIYTSTISIWSQPTISIANSNSCATLGQTVNLIASSSGTNPVTYTWQPSGSNSSSIAVSPSVTTIYTLTASNGSCTSVANTTVNAFTPVTFTNLPTGPWCTFQTINCLESYLAPSTPTPGFWTGPGVITPGFPCTSVFLSSTITPGTYTFVYSYLPRPGGAISTCTVSNQFTINIVPGFSLSVVSPTVTYCANIAVGATVAAIANPSTSVTYTWIPGPINTSSFIATPASNTIYTVNASNGPCSFTNQVAVNVSNACCQSTTNSYITASSVTNQTFVGLYAINQNLTVFGSVIFAGEFLVAKDVSITVVPGATLASGNFTPGAVGTQVHMLACADMWQGVVVQNGGKVLFQSGDLIEDAKEAFVSDGCTTTSGIDISLTNVAFNRNDKSIVIRNYNQFTNNTPFEIVSCVFTCRNFNFPFYQFTGWPTAPVLFAASGPTNTLLSPYLVGGYAPANLKPPFTNRASMNGVSIENSGFTSSPTATVPTYFAINVNYDNFANSGNLFDNQIVGISAKNSNVSSFNNIFQNSRRWQPLPNPNILLLGYGIYTFNDNTHFNTNCRLNMVTTNSATTLFNIFYDCHWGVYNTNLYELNCRFQDFRSTQNNSLPFNNNVRGQYAIYNVSNRFKKYDISNNVFQNIRTCVYVGALQGALNIPSIPAFGLFLGPITMTNNLFSPTIGTVAPTGNGFVNLGIYLGGPLGPSTNTANTFYIPGSQIRITGNNFSRVYRAVHCNGFSNSTYFNTTANNRVTMIPDVIAPPLASQFGFDYINNINDIVNSNTVIGTPITLSQARVTGIYKSMNSTSSIQCNSVVSVYNAFQFEGMNAAAFWRSNLMNTDRRGLVLSTNGNIGQQGSLTSPQDNVWQNPLWWTGTNFHTFTQNSFAINSKVFKRTLAIYNPVNNSGAPAANSYLAAGSLSNTSNSLPIFVCFPSPPPCTTCNPIFVSALVDIATSNVTYTGNATEAEEINMDLTYRDIEIEPGLTDTSSILSTFYSVNDGGNRGAFRNARVSIGAGNHSAANAILSAISPITNIENNSKVFYFLYNTYISMGSLTPGQNITLNILAHQCPFTDGPVVYQARSLFSIVNEDASTYTDDGCVERGYSYGKAIDTTSNDEFEQQLIANEKLNQERYRSINLYRIFPNPAQNSVYIMSLLPNEVLQVQVFDVSGKLLINKSLSINEYKAEFNFSLLSGIYFVHLINEKGEKSVKKLIIAKE